MSDHYQIKFTVGDNKTIKTTTVTATSVSEAKEKTKAKETSSNSGTVKIVSCVKK